MTLSRSSFNRPFARRLAVAIAAAAICATASAALPDFTLSPSALGVQSSDVLADQFQFTDYARVTLTDGGSSFSETGFLRVDQLYLDSLPVANIGTPYGLYVQFEGSGTIDSANKDPFAGVTYGSLTSFSYTLYAYTDASVSFGLDGAGAPFANVDGAMALATGTRILGSVFTGSPNGTSFASSANVKATFTLTDLGKAFFDPDTFNFAEATFSNNPGTVFFGGSSGFSIDAGNGNMNLGIAPAIPEPETYALMLAGIAAVGFVARRRRRV